MVWWASLKFTKIKSLRFAGNFENEAYFFPSRDTHALYILAGVQRCAYVWRADIAASLPRQFKGGCTRKIKQQQTVRAAQACFYCLPPLAEAVNRAM